MQATPKKLSDKRKNMGKSIRFPASNTKIQDQALSYNSSQEKYLSLNSPQQNSKQKKTNPQQIFTNKDPEKNQRIRLKQQKIQRIQETNQMLRRQIQRVWQTLKHNSQKEIMKRDSVMKNESSIESLKMQLNSIQKYILIMKKQIEFKRKVQIKSKNTYEKIRMINNNLKQKKDIIQILKLQLVQNKKIVEQTQKNLDIIKNGNKEQQDKNKRVQFEHIIELVRQTQYSQNKKANNLQKQYNHLKIMEKQLVQKGFTAEQLDSLKNRVINKRIEQIDNEEITKKAPKKVISKTFKQTLEEIKLLVKVNLDYDKFCINLEKDKKKYEEKNTEIKSQLNKYDQQIQNCQKCIGQIKQKVPKVQDRIRMRAIKTQLSVSLQLDLKKSLKAKNSLKISKNFRTKSKSLKHNTFSAFQEPVLKKRTLEAGKQSDNSIKFNDRNIIGRTNIKTRITGIKVYKDKQEQYINGMSFTYDYNLKGGDYIWKEEEDEAEVYYDVQIFNVQNQDLIWKFNGKFNEKGRLAFLQIMTIKGEEQSFGYDIAKVSQQFQFNLSDKQYPVCISGSLKIINCQQKKKSCIENIFIEVLEQTPYFNEF